VSSRLESLQVARLAPRQLGDAAATVADFLRGQFATDGGAMDRDGQSDLYYTVFALDGLQALQEEIEPGPTIAFLRSFHDGAALDLVHLACLARCWAAMPRGALADDVAAQIAHGLERFRSRDGGYHQEPGAACGTVYHAFLARGAHQDLGGDCPDVDALADSVLGLQSGDGAFANGPGLPVGVTTVTAAAVTVLRQAGRPVPDTVGPWLLDRANLDGGGFLAAPQAPIPDLLSTATALHALDGLQVDFSALREPCLDFLDSLWTGTSFCGNWTDEVLDSEYTFYALLALGHLSL
jgi:hypothetical protein